MNIGILGAPKTGKSDVAQKLADELFYDYIVDGYIDRLQKDLDISLDTETLYLPNLMLAMWRETEERKIYVLGGKFITVGTTLDTLVYAAVNAERFAQLPIEYQTEQTRGQAVMEMSAAQVLGFVVMDTIRKYDILFYCKPSALNKIQIVGIDAPKKDPSQEMIDQGLQVFLAKYGVPVIELTGSAEQKAAQALEAINEARGTSVHGDGGQGVDGQDSGDGDSVKSTGEPVAD